MGEKSGLSFATDTEESRERGWDDWKSGGGSVLRFCLLLLALLELQQQSRAALIFGVPL